MRLLLVQNSPYTHFWPTNEPVSAGRCGGGSSYVLGNDR